MRVYDPVGLSVRMTSLAMKRRNSKESNVAHLAPENVIVRGK